MVMGRYIHAGLAAVVAIVVALLSAAAVAVFNDPGVRTEAAKLGCPAVNQLIVKYSKQTGAEFDAVKCISVTATDPTHWTAVVQTTLAGVSRQWAITFSGDGVQITGATPVPSS